jgi:glycosyltransferase involved in cell wall biosynthesis
VPLQKPLVSHVACSDLYGGASRAGYRIFSALNANLADAYDFRMLVREKLSDNPVVIRHYASKSKFARMHSWSKQIMPKTLKLLGLASQGFQTGNPVHHSECAKETNILSHIQAKRAALLHLHWIGNLIANETVSIEEIGNCSIPIVWTLHDQWAFCGAEHYTTPPQLGESASGDERFAQCYTPSSRPSHEAGPDLNRLTWLRKRRAWRRPMQIVCPSTWLADCARRSSLMADWPITVIPYPIDLTTWAPFDQRQARALLQLPQDRPLVLFGAMGGTADPRKGADLLLQALQHLRINVADTPLEKLELVVFGQGRPAQPPDLGFSIHYSGLLHDDLSLRLLYAAADVFVIPSRQDNLPNTGLEAHACGTPVVAFATGGLVDIVADRITGALAEPFDCASLAAAINWVLQDEERRRLLGAAARQRAETLWNPSLVAQMYNNVYEQALQANP